jgi:hypothetical protein
MRAAIICLLLVSCTPTIEKVERHDPSMTDSAMSVLSTIGKDTVALVQVRTIEKTLVRYVQSEPIRVAMVRPLPIERRGCDTVYIRDTVYIGR